MGKYYNQLKPEVKKYFKILSEHFPEWLEEYIDTAEMKRISHISMNCGKDYSNCFKVGYFYSNLDHSVGVALIIWNFTHDKKQTLAGFFHDIATPVFKHCIDFMNGDYKNQHSTEDKTTYFIQNSKKIMNLLKRDKIQLHEVCDYKMYPLADNESPKLSADRFEYTFSSGLAFFRIWELDKIEEVYKNITIVKNEEGIDEFCFRDMKVGEDYISSISKLWPQWVSDSDRTQMQFIADMCRSLNRIGKLEIDDLYSLSEKEVIHLFETCEDDYLKKAWNNFLKCTTSYKTDKILKGKYCINVMSKTRYINPLVIVDGKALRIYDASKTAKKLIDDYLKSPKGGYYTYFDFDFTPY